MRRHLLGQLPCQRIGTPGYPAKGFRSRTSSYLVLLLLLIFRRPRTVPGCPLPVATRRQVRLRVLRSCSTGGWPAVWTCRFTSWRASCTPSATTATRRVVCWTSWWRKSWRASSRSGEVQGGLKAYLFLALLAGALVLDRPCTSSSKCKVPRKPQRMCLGR